MRIYFPILILVFILNFSLLSSEAEEKFKINGYYKNLFISSKTLTTEESYFADLNRFRLNLKAKPQPSLFLNIVYEHEMMFDDFSHTTDFDLIRQKNQNEQAFIDLDHVITDKNNFYERHSLYRAYLKYMGDRTSLSLGKQAIDWGRMRFWSPLDLFNPVVPLDVEKEERTGVDAINLNFSFPKETSLNFVYAPQESLSESVIGTLIYGKIKEYDIFFMASEYKKDEVLGVGFDGYLKGAGLRAEFTFTRQDNHKEYLRASLGSEYSFPNRVHLLGEYFYNGGAEDNDISAFISSYQISRKLLTLKKHLLGFQLNYEITPLLKIEDSLIYDFTGESLYFNPELRYNLWTNFDFSLGAQLPWGSNDSEFGPYQSLYYTQIKLFF